MKYFPLLALLWILHENPVTAFETDSYKASFTQLYARSNPSHNLHSHFISQTHLLGTYSSISTYAL